MSVELLPILRPVRVPWNKGHIIGQKRPLMPRHVWSIRVRLEVAGNAHDLALFNMAGLCCTNRVTAELPLSLDGLIPQLS